MMPLPPRMDSVDGDRARPTVVGSRKGVEDGLVEMLQGQGGKMEEFLFPFLQGLTRCCHAMLSPQDLSPDPLTCLHGDRCCAWSSPASHLVPGIRRVYPLLVAAGFQEDADGIQLQEHLAGHRVKEGDVGKGRRGQQEDFPGRGLLAQFWMARREKIPSLRSAFTSVFSFGSHNSSGRKSVRVL